MLTTPRLIPANGTIQVLSLSQFQYDYGSGQWQHQGLFVDINGGTWSLLGASGLSADFLGDGYKHNLGSVNSDLWSYQLFDENYCVWTNNSLNGLDQFKYTYNFGLWYDQGYMGNPNGWYNLSGIEMPANFLGDGLFHQIKVSTWWYGFNHWNGDQMGEWWGPCGGSAGFFYNYLNGQWWTAGGKGSTSATYWGTGPLGGPGKSTLFMGDGGYHDLDGAHEFQFVDNHGQSNCYGLWTGGTYKKWRYDYADGQWEYSVDGTHLAPRLQLRTEIPSQVPRLRRGSCSSSARISPRARGQPLSYRERDHTVQCHQIKPNRMSLVLAVVGRNTRNVGDALNTERTIPKRLVKV